MDSRKPLADMQQPPPFGQGTTRRSFLSHVGKAGGAAVMYGTMEALGLFRGTEEARAEDTFKPLVRGGATADVLILGAGIAGLTAAYELLKGGYRVTIVEPRSRAGGRNWTARRGTAEAEIDGPLQVCDFSKGEYMNMGPARLPQGHITIDYCRELGVPLEVFTNQNAQAYYYNENTATQDFGTWAGKPIPHRMAKADYYGYVSELLAKCVNQGALDTDLTPADKDRVLAFLRSFGSIPASTYRYTGSSRRGYSIPPQAGDQPGVPLGDVPRLEEVFQSQLGLNFSFEFGWTQAMLMFQPVGGMDAIPAAFERAIRKLGGKILYDCEVTDIRNTSAGVDVVVLKSGGKGQGFYALSSQYCICTIPPQILKRIPSNFSPEILAALNKPTGVNTGKVGLEYSRRFWEQDERILGGITNTNLNIGTIWYPSSGFGKDRGLVVGSYNFGGNAAFYESLTPQQRVDEAVAQGMKIHGAPYRDLLRSAYTVQWMRVEHSEGGWVNWPGGRGAEYLLLSEPTGNVYFAGDHLSYEIAWQVGAIYSARRAVESLHARVTSVAQRRVVEQLVQVA